MPSSDTPHMFHLSKRAIAALVILGIVAVIGFMMFTQRSDPYAKPKDDPSQSVSNNPLAPCNISGYNCPPDAPAPTSGMSPSSAVTDPQMPLCVHCCTPTEDCSDTMTMPLGFCNGLHDVTVSSLSDDGQSYNISCIHQK